MMRETKVVLKSIEMEMLIFLIISAVVPKFFHSMQQKAYQKD